MLYLNLQIASTCFQTTTIVNRPPPVPVRMLNKEGIHFGHSSQSSCSSCSLLFVRPFDVCERRFRFGEQVFELQSACNVDFDSNAPCQSWSFSMTVEQTLSNVDHSEAIVSPFKKCRSFHLIDIVSLTVSISFWQQIEQKRCRLLIRMFRNGFSFRLVDNIVCLAISILNFRWNLGDLKLGERPLLTAFALPNVPSTVFSSTCSSFRSQSDTEYPWNVSNNHLDYLEYATVSSETCSE